jgi:hypothetical protein
MPPITGESKKPNIPGVLGKSDLGVGVHGENENGNIGPDKGVGVWGESKNGFGVFGSSDHHRGIRGISKFSVGVNGINEAPTVIQPDRGCGVHGEAVNGYGVFGSSDNHEGVRGISSKGAGVSGVSGKWIGTYGESQDYEGVRGVSHAGDYHGGVVGLNDNTTPTAGPGVYGRSDVGAGIFGESSNGIGVFGKSSRLAGFFEGDVEVTGDIRLTNADCAEDFDVLDSVTAEPGTVMVLGDEGGLSASSKAYDKRVAGVVSGAGSYKPGIVLDKQISDRIRRPIALLGKVYCKVDAQYGPIEIGDLLTTSSTLGHAMLVSDSSKSSGAVIGKALKSFNQGTGIIPILIALQ